MNRHSLGFVTTFLLTAGAVIPLVYAGMPLYALGVGVAGLLLHWIVSRGGDRDGEVADSSYFFGFLLTLVFLAVGVYRIGVQSDAGGSVNILGFLEDLAAGLGATIFGLVIRQIRTLGHSAETRGSGPPELLEIQKQLASNLSSMIALWNARPEHQVLDILNESRSIARDTADKLDRSIAAAAKRMLESVETLDQATTSATQSLTRAASGVSSSMSEMAQRLEVEIQHVVTAVQKSAAQHEQQLELWQSSLEQARAAITLAHRTLEEEYRRSMQGFSESSQAFAQLAEQVTAHVQALPNPAERLAGLWDGVRQLETDLTEAIAGSVLELGALRERAQDLTHALDQLGGSAERTATAIGAGGERLGGALERELQQMNEIIEQYVRVLEGTQRSLRVRA